MKTVSILKFVKYAQQVLMMFAILIQTYSLHVYGQSAHRMTETKENDEALINTLRMLVGASHEAVEIRLHGFCVVPYSEAITVPPILWEDVGGEGDLAAIIRAALRENKQLSVARISPHVIVIRDTTVPQELLETRIDSLSPTKLEQYSPESAIAAAINSKAIQLALRRLDMRLAVSETGLQHVNASGEPHLGRHIKNVTLNGVLFSVLEKFGGFVVYEDCADSQGKRRFDVRYYK